MDSLDKIKIHMMAKSGILFVDIAKQLGGSAKDLAKIFVEVEERQRKFKSREKIVYRKRINKVKK